MVLTLRRAAALPRLRGINKQRAITASAAERRRSQHQSSGGQAGLRRGAPFWPESSVCLLDSGRILRVWHRFCRKSKTVNRKQ